MGYTIEKLYKIFCKNNGHCRHCGRKLSFRGYGFAEMGSGWEVDHSVPKSRGGADNIRNLIPSCIPCNRLKGNLTTREFSR